MTALSKEEIAEIVLIEEMRELTDQFDNEDINIEMFKERATQLINGEIFEVPRPSPLDWDATFDEETRTYTATHKYVPSRVEVYQSDEQGKVIYFKNKYRGEVWFRYDEEGNRTAYKTVLGDEVNIRFTQELTMPIFKGKEGR